MRLPVSDYTDIISGTVSKLQYSRLLFKMWTLLFSPPFEGA